MKLRREHKAYVRWLNDSGSALDGTTSHGVSATSPTPSWWVISAERMGRILSIRLSLLKRNRGGQDG